MNYPVNSVRIPNSTCALIDFILSLPKKPDVYFELGCNIGSTAREVSKILPASSHMYLFDFKINQKFIKDLLRDNRLFFGSDHTKYSDSYNWHLMTLYNKGVRPDFVFIDGKHTFDTDWLAFFLIDRMILPNGYIYFDDYNWTIETSPTMNEVKFPQIKDQYTDEQIRSKHIKILIDSVVKKSYKEIIPNKLYQNIVLK
jgi:hypothetical protein